jgi:glutathione S-transferase
LKYCSVAAARSMSGLRLVLTTGVPGPWSEAAKGIFHVKGIPFIPVGQESGGVNRELVDWAGVPNAPVAILDDEPPRDGWLDILLLAERLQPYPRLLPADSEGRIEVVGISSEICGEGGFGWCRRTTLMAQMPSPPDETQAASLTRLRTRYRCDREALDASQVRLAEIVSMLCRRLQIQRAAASPYLVGSALTAADIYWACFAALLNPLPYEVNPMPASVRERYRSSTPLLDKIKDPILFQHRDFIYANHLSLPLDY